MGAAHKMLYGGTKPPPTVVSATASSTSNSLSQSLSTTIPSSLAAGNLLVALFSWSSPSAPNTPSGWTLNSSANSTHNVTVFTKISTGSDTAPTFTWPVNGWAGAIIWNIHGASGLDGSCREADVGGGGAGNDAFAPSLSPSGSNRLWLVTGVSNAGTTISITSPSGFHQDAVTTSGNRAAGFSKVQTLNSATGTADVNQSINFDLVAGDVLVAP